MISDTVDSVSFLYAIKWGERSLTHSKLVYILEVMISLQVIGDTFTTL